MSTDFTRIGARIKRFRIDKNLTQEQLGEAVHSSTAMITAIERGVKAPSVDTLVAIANELNVSSDDILIDSLTCSPDNDDTIVHNILLNCNLKERVIIIEALKGLKNILTKHGV